MKKKGFTLLDLMIVIAVIGVLVTIAIPLYNSYSSRAKASEVPIILKDIVKFQFIYREYPASNGQYANGLRTIGVKTNLGTFAENPEDCSTETNTENDENHSYACSKYYGFSTSKASSGVTCAANGIGNFSWAKAISEDELMRSDLAGCMTEDFHYKHGAGGN